MTACKRTLKRNLKKDFLCFWIPKLDVMYALLKIKRVHVSAADEIELLRSDIVSKDQKISQLEEALREMSLSESKVEISRSDRKGLELVNKESFVCDGTVDS